MNDSRQEDPQSLQNIVRRRARRVRTKLREHGRDDPRSVLRDANDVLETAVPDAAKTDLSDRFTMAIDGAIARHGLQGLPDTLRFVRATAEIEALPIEAQLQLLGPTNRTLPALRDLVSSAERLRIAVRHRPTLSKGEIRILARLLVAMRNLSVHPPAGFLTSNALHNLFPCAAQAMIEIAERYTTARERM